MTKELLIELGCEDLPARYVWPLAEALTQGFTGGFAKRNIACGTTKTFATPRRIAVRVDSVADKQPNQTIERRGPALAAAYKDGQPTPAALGFAKSCGVGIESLAQENGYLVFRKKQPGRKTAELIPDIFEETLKQMDELVPKRMRWSSGDETFVRPVQWIVAMFGSKVIPIARFGLAAGKKTYGHRFHAPKAITLKSPAEYENALSAAKVWADFASRRAEIWKQIEAEAAKLGGAPHHNDDLLDEVTALVEWPVVISGRIEERFLELPPEVIIATIEHNQRYFPVFAPVGAASPPRARACRDSTSVAAEAAPTAQARLLPVFITVSNIESKDVQQVITGNERVVRPRLSDAMFFWEQDRKKKLADFVPELDRVTFQKDLGSVGDKVRRVTKLAGQVAGLLSADSRVAERAAVLCKADLTTRMVYEFPELQGIMGGYYAAASGEPEEVARAIREHYQPTQAGGAIPSTRIGQIAALADKLDILSGIFAIGQRPTASKDPYALRRAALGVLRICIEGKLPLDVKTLLKSALEAQPAGKRDSVMLNDLWDFVLERLRGLMTDRGVSVEVLNAVAAIGTTVPTDFVSRVEAVSAFLKLPEAQQLSAAHKRVRNILRQAGARFDGPTPDPALFGPEAEQVLYKELCSLEAEISARARNGQYTEALTRLAKLQAPVDRFFDDVMVMDENPAVRENRLKLLARLDENCRKVADISCLPG